VIARPPPRSFDRRYRIGDHAPTGAHPLRCGGRGLPRMAVQGDGKGRFVSSPNRGRADMRPIVNKSPSAAKPATARKSGFLRIRSTRPRTIHVVVSDGITAIVVRDSSRKTPPRWEAPDFPRQRPTHCSLTLRNVGGSPTPGNHTAETALAGWGARIRTWEWGESKSTCFVGPPAHSESASNLLIGNGSNFADFSDMILEIKGGGLVVRPNHARVIDDRVPHRLAWPGLVQFSQYLCGQFCTDGLSGAGRGRIRVTYAARTANTT
jgi:hypothetical protein